MMQTRTMLRFEQGNVLKDVIETPLIGNAIVHSLLKSKDWVAVFNMMQVFRFHDGLDDINKQTLLVLRQLNEYNKFTYRKMVFVDRIAMYVTRIQSSKNIRQRIRLNNMFFNHVCEYVDIFKLNDAMQDSVRSTLTYYYLNEPLYELQAKSFLKYLCPEYFYDEYDFIEFYDDHESWLFDNEIE